MLGWLDKLYNDPEYVESVMIRAEDMDEERCKDVDDRVAKNEH